MRRILRILIVAYTLVVILLGFFQRNLMYHPHRVRAIPVAQDQRLMRLFSAASDIKIECKDGVSIGGWLLQKERRDKDARDIRRPLILFFHGNAGHRGHRFDWYQLFHDAGADVLAIDYHGYGDSGGRMSESALEMDCDAAWHVATKQLGYQPSDIIVVGNSLGGAAAVYTASQHTKTEDSPAALMAVATFSSMVDVASSLYRWLPVKAVLVDRYPSDQRIAKVKCPIVILHGEADRLVYARFGRKLFDAAPDKSIDGIDKTWIGIPRVGHNNLAVEAGADVRQQLNRIIQRWKSDR